MASVIERPRCSNWVAQWYINGKIRRRTTKIAIRPMDGKAAVNYRKALQIADAFERAEKGEASAEALAAALHAAGDTLRKVNLVTAREYLTSYRPGGLPQSQSNALRAVALFLDFLTKRKLDMFALADVKRKHCEVFLGELLQEVSEGTVTTHRKRLSAAFNAAVRDEVITINPFAHVSMAEVVNRYSPDTKGKDKTERDTFTTEELQTIFYRFPQPYCDLAAVSYYTAGQRLNDCVHLKWEQVDFENGLIRFCTQKTAKRLVLPLMPELRRRLEERRKLTKDKENPYVFPALVMQTARAKGAVSVQFGAQLKAFGIVKEQPTETKKGKRRTMATKSFHGIRNTAITRLREGGVPADVSRSVVGHDSEAVERAYYRPSAGAQMSALSVLADGIKPPTE